MSNQPTYTESLKRATARSFRKNPKAGWRNAKEEAKTYLHDILNKYPSTPAIMRNYRYVQKVRVGVAIKNAFQVFHG